MVLYLNNVSCDSHVTLVRPAESVVRLPELDKYGDGGQNAGNKSGSVRSWLQKAGFHCANARRPWGDTIARHHVEVSGATRDAHWLHRSMRPPAACFANVASPLIHVLRLQTHPPLL